MRRAGGATLGATVVTAALAAVLAGCGTPGQRLPAAESDVGDPVRGHELIQAYGCGSCHVVPGVRQADGLVGPPLSKFGRRSYIAGELPNGSENLQRWLRNPQSVEPGTAMPDLGVTEIDAKDIAAYLLNLE